MIKSIEHVGIYANDSKLLAEWYVNTLEFKIIVEKNGNYFIKAEDNSLIEICKAIEDIGRFSDKASGIRHIALMVDDFEAVVEKLYKANVEVVIEPKISDSGVKTFFFADPEGNVLHLIARKSPLA